MNTKLKTITLTKGLYRISAIGAPSAAHADSAVAIPSLLIAPTLRGGHAGGTFLGRTRDFALLSGRDSMTILHVHLPTADFCVFSITEDNVEPLDLKLDALSMRSEPPAAPATTPAPPVEAPAAPVRDDHIVLHVTGLGDIRVAAENDLALQAGQAKVEGFSLHASLPGHTGPLVEYKALAVNGAETTWVKGGGFCGSRGHGLSLIGLAIRPTSPAVECEYRVRFLSGVLSTVVKNGVPVKSSKPSDPIAHISVHVRLKSESPAAVPAPVPAPPTKAKAPAGKPATKPAPKPAAKTAPKPATKPATKPVAQPAKSAKKPAPPSPAKKSATPATKKGTRKK